jgi:hypothetical protein
MAEIQFESVEKQPIQVVPGDFYMNDDGVVVSLVEHKDGSFALFDSLSGQQYTDFETGRDMFDYLNNPSWGYSHRPKSRILIV